MLASPDYNRGDPTVNRAYEGQSSGSWLTGAFGSVLDNASGIAGIIGAVKGKDPKNVVDNARAAQQPLDRKAGDTSRYMLWGGLGLVALLIGFFVIKKL